MRNSPPAGASQPPPALLAEVNAGPFFRTISEAKRRGVRAG